MIDMFNSIIGFLSQHKAAITAVLTSGTLAGIISLIVALVRFIKLFRKSKDEVMSLKESVENFNDLKDKLTFVGTELVKLNDTLQIVAKQQETVVEDTSISDNEINEKLSGVIDILQAAFSTIRSDIARDNINNIVSNLKYGSSKRREEILQRLSELKKVVEEATENSNATVGKILDEATEIVGQSVSSGLINRRY